MPTGPIARISRSGNYGVAPIVVDDTVMGMVPADSFLKSRDVHRDECTALAVVAEILGAHLGRLLVLDHLDALRRVGPLWSNPGPARARSLPTLHEQPIRRRADDPPVKLPDRERDVIELMAQGETNYGIARHLHITEVAAKTHASNIQPRWAPRTVPRPFRAVGA